MDAPPIQYARTADGANIAFWSIGQGPPLVILPNLAASHLAFEWEFQPRRTAFELLARGANVIRFDPRGVGLSQQGVRDFSAEAMTLDLEAVVDRLALERFGIIGYSYSGDLTCAYVAGHPDRVSHLIVMVPSFSRNYMRRLTALFPLVDQDWELFTETFARTFLGWTGDLAHEAVVTSMADWDLTSAYHRWSDCAHGEEPEWTWRRPHDGVSHHIDYVFVPKPFADRVARCDVVRHPDAVRASDHFPVVADLSDGEPASGGGS
jgi:pimeloyl-ACP methyl ester carboxylesterase